MGKIMALSENILKEYTNPVFIETGTYKGDGVQAALDAGFERIISFEAADELYHRCVERFKDNKNVTIYKSDSGDTLRHIIKMIPYTMTFWLDAHACGIVYFENGEGGYHEVNSFDGNPLMDEIKAISKHPIKTHTILIDDWRIFGTGKVIKEILKINPNYKITFRDGTYPKDIMVAKI